MSEKTMISKKTLLIERYKRPQRIHHWVHVLFMIIFFFTGLELFLKMYFVGDYFLTRGLHYTLGIFIGIWDLIIYTIILAKYDLFNEIIPTPRDFLDLTIIALCYLKILPDSKYPKYDYYNLEEKKYVMKYHPAQKLLAIPNLGGIFVMGVTGILMAEALAPGSTSYLVPGIVVGLFELLVTPLRILNIDLRLVHFLGYLYFILTTIVHFYFAIIPQNRNRLKGMVTGVEEINLE